MKSSMREKTKADLAAFPPKTVSQRIIARLWLRDFPGGAVVKNLPANAGDTGSRPGLGRFPHAAEQLSPCTTTTEPAL